MPVNLVGTYASRERMVTGLLSLDYALAHQDLNRCNTMGIPMGTGNTVYSETTGVGKSVLTLSLAAMIAAYQNRSIALMPTDTFDMDNAMAILEYAGVNNDFHLIANDDPLMQH